MLKWLKNLYDPPFFGTNEDKYKSSAKRVKYIKSEPATSAPNEEVVAELTDIVKDIKAQ